MHKIYLGWNSPYHAWTLDKAPVVVMQSGKDVCVLTDQEAHFFRSRVRELTYHSCGVKKFAWVTRMLKEIGGSTEDAYEYLFNYHFEPDPHLEVPED